MQLKMFMERHHVAEVLTGFDDFIIPTWNYKLNVKRRHHHILIFPVIQN